MRASSLWLVLAILFSAVMLAPRPAYANCATPTGKEGEFFYNLDYKVMQFCNGTDWVSMTGSSGGGGGGTGVTDGNKGDITVSGSGSSWLINDASVTPAAIAPDALDFTEFKDAMTLDASTDIAISGSNVLSLTNTGTGNSFVVNDQASDTTPFVIDAAGSVGVDNATPTQVLDVNGKATANSLILKQVTGAAAPAGSGGKLIAKSAAPATCDASANGTLALTALYTTCVCRNGTGWVSDHDGISACVWMVDPCAGSPSIGDVCADGSIYAGISPDGSNKMFTTHCDFGMTWNGTSCTGTHTLSSWNNGTSTWYDIPAVTNCTTAGVCNALGQANTAAIAAETTSGNGGPHQAATKCDSLSEDGQSDWYLPSLPELNVLYTNKATGGLSGTFDTTGTYYWASSEYGNTTAWVERFSVGTQVTLPKSLASAPVRCVRR